MQRPFRHGLLEHSFTSENTRRTSWIRRSHCFRLDPMREVNTDFTRLRPLCTGRCAFVALHLLGVTSMVLHFQGVTLLGCRTTPQCATPSGRYAAILSVTTEGITSSGRYN